MKTEVKLETITPELAADWLAKHNQNNRPMSDMRVAILAEQNQKGNWILTNDAIGFDSTGRLFNGQHRLAACVKSGVPITCLVLRGADPKAFMVTDIGMKKTGAQALNTLGEQNSSALAALARLVANTIMTGGPMTAYTGVRAIPPNEVIDTVNAYPILKDIVIDAKYLTYSHDRIAATTTSVGLTLWLAHEAGCYADYLAFLKKVGDQVELPRGGPEIALRRRLSNLTGNSANVSREKSALLIKAYNAAKAGAMVSVLSWRQDEAFPTFT